MILKTAASSCIDAGKYPATCTDFDIAEGKFGEQFRFKFDVTTPAGVCELTAYAGSYEVLRPNQKGAKWIGALYPHEIDWSSGEIDSREIIGSPCYVRVIVKDVTTDSGDTIEVNRIDAVLPRREARVERDDFDPFGDADVAVAVGGGSAA